MQIDFSVDSSFSFFNNYSISKNIRSVGVGVGRSERNAAIPFVSWISAVSEAAEHPQPKCLIDVAVALQCVNLG